MKNSWNLCDKSWYSCRKCLSYLMISIYLSLIDWKFRYWTKKIHNHRYRSSMDYLKFKFLHPKLALAFRLSASMLFFKIFLWKDQDEATKMIFFNFRLCPHQLSKVPNEKFWAPQGRTTYPKLGKVYET